MEAIIAKENNIIIEMQKVSQKIKDIDKDIRKLQSEKQKFEEIHKELEKNHIKCIEEKLHIKDWNSTDFDWSEKVHLVLKNIFKMQKFRLYQHSAINAVMSKQDCLLLMPTGGGKSLCYQLPAKILKGITIVVTPLVSLMEDQVMALKELNYPATMLSSSVATAEQRNIMKQMSNENCPFKIIYVTPEKISKSKVFMSSLQKAYQCGLFSLLAIDEVHCCSQWGHDFRPDYKILGIMKRQYPAVPILGVTATATPEILDDVKNFLDLEGCLTFKVPFDRPNLKYEVIQKPSQPEEVLKFLVSLITEKFKGCSGIIYCFSIKECIQITSELRQHKIKASCYHSQLLPEERSSTHKKWSCNQIQVVVATVAFGMGIDKPDVRFVIHHSMPKAMESYYQESGRAGRDDQIANCILLYNVADIFRLSTLLNGDRKALKKLYVMVKYCLELEKCRRALIAEHFSESWEKEDCNKMCDHCTLSKGAIIERDLATQCFYIFTIIRHCTAKDKRITGLKLINICIGQCESALKPPKTNVHILSRGKYERIIASMLVNGYLKEAFSYTPYAVNSYIEIDDVYKFTVCSSDLNFKCIMPASQNNSDSQPIKAKNEVTKNIKPATSKKLQKYGSSTSTKRKKKDEMNEDDYVPSENNLTERGNEKTVILKPQARNDFKRMKPSTVKHEVIHSPVIIEQQKSKEYVIRQERNHSVAIKSAVTNLIEEDSIAAVNKDNAIEKIVEKEISIVTLD